MNKTIYKSNILNLKRVQTSVNRNLFKGLNLDRNERVDLFSEKIQKEIRSKLSKHIFNVTPDISSLYKNLARYLKIKVFNIYLTQGITEAIFQILFSYTKKNDEVIILDETYPMYKILCQLRDVNYKTWSFRKNLELNLNDLEKIITKRTKIVFLVNPNLPIEYEFNSRFKNEIYKICKKKKILLVYDEAYYHFGSKTEITNAIKKNNIFVLRTFSKAWSLPGIRLGYVIGTRKNIKYLSKCRSLVETNGFSFEIANWALKNDKIMHDHIKLVKEGYNYLMKKLKNLKINFYGGRVTNAILIDLKTKKNSLSLKNYLYKKNIYIRTGFNGPIKNCVRISLCSSKKLKKFFYYFSKWKHSLSFQL